ncbi:MAG: hypothetical protein ABSA17_06670 [Rhabdochlamydiaceae bacterium]|jgi:hypothetical protein
MSYVSLAFDLSAYVHGLIDRPYWDSPFDSKLPIIDNVSRFERNVLMFGSRLFIVSACVTGALHLGKVLITMNSLGKRVFQSAEYGGYSAIITTLAAFSIFTFRRPRTQALTFTQELQIYYSKITNITFSVKLSETIGIVSGVASGILLAAWAVSDYMDKNSHALNFLREYVLCPSVGIFLSSFSIALAFERQRAELSKLPRDCFYKFQHFGVAETKALLDVIDFLREKKSKGECP